MSTQPPEEILEEARRRIAARREEERSAGDSRLDRERPWRVAFLAVLGALLLALLLVPAPLDWKLYAVVHGLIAQVHNVFVDGRQLPLCARNLGLYGSFLITTLWLFWRGRGRAGALPPRPLLALLLLFVLAMAVDGFNSLFGDMGLRQLYPPQNLLRTITGAAMGITMAGLILLVFNRTLRSDVERAQPVMAWADLGGALALNALFVLAAYSDIGPLYWPVALIGFGGIVGQLFVINTLVAATVMGYSRAVSRLGQLARPATVGLITNTLIIGGLALLRFWEEGGL